MVQAITVSTNSGSYETMHAYSPSRGGHAYGAPLPPHQHPHPTATTTHWQAPPPHHHPHPHPSGYYETAPPPPMQQHTTHHAHALSTSHYAPATGHPPRPASQYHHHHQPPAQTAAYVAAAPAPGIAATTATHDASTAYPSAAAAAAAVYNHHAHAHQHYHRTQSTSSAASSGSHNNSSHHSHAVAHHRQHAHPPPQPPTHHHHAQRHHPSTYHHHNHSLPPPPPSHHTQAPPAYSRTAAHESAALKSQTQQSVDSVSESTRNHGKSISNQLPAAKNAPPHQEQQQQQQQHPKNGFSRFIKSPITMCFERMLGAAEMIATVKRPFKPAAVEPVEQENAKPTEQNVNTKAPVEAEYINTKKAHKPVRLERKFVSGSKRQISEALGNDSKTTTTTNITEKTTLLSGPNPFDEIAADSKLARQVILLMALQRNLGDDATSLNTDANDEFVEQTQQESSNSSKSTVIEDGFYWRDFPICEQVLYKHMGEYYGISSGQRQSKIQQNFNRMLVQQVQKAAKDAGFSFAKDFTEKKLRDRIRCFYKTHLQNAKKRLATLQKHNDSADNQSILRVYIRCVRQDLSFEESLQIEEDENAAAAASATSKSISSQPRKRSRRMSQIEKAKLALKAHKRASLSSTGTADTEVESPLPSSSQSAVNHAGMTI